MEQVMIICPPGPASPRWKLIGYQGEGNVIVPLAQPPDFEQDVVATLHDMRMHRDGIALASSNGTTVGRIQEFKWTTDRQGFQVLFGGLRETDS